MKPIDARNATWTEIRAQLHGRRMHAYEAWQKWGPGTTHEVAERSGMSVLALRPRTTELVALGLVQMTDMANREGIYAAIPEDIALERFIARQEAQRSEGLQLPLKLEA